MKVNLFSSSGIFQNNLVLDGFTLSNFLVLYRNPDSANEAATKRYVDGIPSVYDVSQIVGNPVPKDLLVSGFGGDLMGFNRSDVYLTPTGVQPGNYNRVTVNAKGRITTGATENLNGTVLYFANITGKPMNASGYVSDTTSYAMKPNGASSALNLTGNVIANGSPSTATQVATQTYLGGKTSTMTPVLPVGGLKVTTFANAGAKYLRANGAVLDKTTYASLYAIIGDSYPGWVDGYMGQPWRQQYAFNPTDNGVSQTWTTATALPAAVIVSQAIVTKNRVYLLGGLINGTPSATVYTAPINADGTLDTWTTATALPGTVAYSQAIVTNSRVYLLGGVVNGDYSATVYTAPINTDGTLGTWTTATALPGTVAYSQAIVTKSRVYLLGGYINSATSSTVYTAPINADGTLGTWTTATALPATVYYSQAIVTKNRVYLLGGAINGGASSTVYTAPINADGTLGTWTTATALPGTVAYSQAIVTKNRVYLLGGYINGAYSSTVYTAPINTDGTLGTWTTATALPGMVYYSQAIVTKNRVYLLGGTVNGASTVYTAPFSGGTNDYLTLIANNSIDSSTQFKLPDLSAQTNGVMEYFIRAIP